MCFHYWWGVCFNVKSVFAYWFCEAGVFINLVFLLIVTYWPICWIFLCKVDSWPVKTYYSFYAGILNFPQGKNLLSLYLLQGCRYSLFVLLREFPQISLTCLKNAGGWGRSIGLFEGGTSRAWNERNLRSNGRGLKACSDFAIPGCQIHHLSYVEAKENGRDMTLSAVLMWICRLY